MANAILSFTDDSGLKKFRLDEDIGDAAGFLGQTVEPDQRGVADGGENVVVNALAAGVSSWAGASLVAVAVIKCPF